MSPRLAALLFVVVGSAGLPFAALGLFVFGAVLAESPSLPELFNLALFGAVVGAGLFLFVGYVKRLRERPFRLSPAYLWLATIFYNMVGLVASVLLYWPLALLYGGLVLAAVAAYRAELAAPSP